MSHRGKRIKISCLVALTSNRYKDGKLPFLTPAPHQVAKMPATVSNANADRIVYMSDLHKRPALFAGWERLRHGKFHWVAESFAEMVCLFFDSEKASRTDLHLRWVYFSSRLFSVDARIFRAHTCLSVYAGVGSQAVYILGNLLQQAGLSCPFVIFCRVDTPY